MSERAIWTAWWIGTALIALSWLKVVPVRVGWVGFCIAGGSTLVSVVQQRYWRRPPREQGDGTRTRDSE